MKSISSRAPINKLAAIVTASGFSYQPNCKVQVQEYVGPPEMVPKYKHPKIDSFKDLTGIKKGRFTVIGLMANEKGKWVVRCVCGTYTTRSAKAIKSVDKNPNAHLDACRECMHNAYRKREESYRRTGKDANIEDYL